MATAMRTMTFRLALAHEVKDTQTASKSDNNHLRLAPACEGEEDTQMASKCDNDPPLARSCTRGRWKTRELCRNGTTTTSGSLVYAREVEDTRTTLKCDSDHLQLTLVHEGGGIRMNCFETQQQPPQACSCMRGRWGTHKRRQNVTMTHLWLALVCEGGGGGPF
jgi:hypothetical protein